MATHSSAQVRLGPSATSAQAQDQLLQIITFGLQRAAGPFGWAGVKSIAIGGLGIDCDQGITN
jgi:hypothetical protein